MEWSDWFQQQAGNILGAAAQAKYVQPYEVQKLRLQALGEAGIYEEGQPGTQRPGGGIAGISPSMLLIGGAVILAVVLLKD